MRGARGGLFEGAMRKEDALARQCENPPRCEPWGGWFRQGLKAVARIGGILLGSARCLKEPWSNAKERGLKKKLRTQGNAATRAKA